MPNDQIIARDPANRLSGRLVAARSTQSALEDHSRDINSRGIQGLAIDFPSMPDAIDLNRATDYAVLPNAVTPDGIHQYRSTKPLEIPFSFRLHSQDRIYCPQGSLTLLQVAARLHAFTLPLAKGNGRVLISPAVRETASGQADDNTIEKNADNEPVFTLSKSSTATGLFNPVTCWLHLIWVAESSPGISCIGYVRDIGVKLLGPWLRGPGGSFNLPTAGEFSFTFVHRPGHGNDYSDGQGFSRSGISTQVDSEPQAYGGVVKESLYNTRNLVALANYRGFDD